MKGSKFLLLLFLLSAACSSPSSQEAILQKRVDSLEKAITQTYRPGFGEFMSDIQVHHAKLWFAGINKNWKLADFEIHEILESLDGIKQYDTDRTESQYLYMLDPALDSIQAAIRQENLPVFRSSFRLLTQTCNNCHKEVHYDFNQVKIPQSPPFSNQIFRSDSL